MRYVSALICTCLLAFGVPLRADEPANPPTPAQVRKAAERGLGFLEADAAKWRKEKDCATCHHGTLTVWALAEAKSRGYAVKDETFADVVKWTKERFLKDIDKERDTRPGWNMVNSSALYLAVMAQAVPKQDALAADDLKRIAGHLVRHQEADGAWAWSLAPAKNRPPPFFESDEVATLLADVALAPHVPADPQEKSDVRDSRDKGRAWLAKAKPTGTTQALAFRLFRDTRAVRPRRAFSRRSTPSFSARTRTAGGGRTRTCRATPTAPGRRSTS